MAFIEIKDLKKSYGEGEGRTQVLSGVSARVEKGELCGIFGPSGSGKSTLLNIIGGIDTADSGEVNVGGQDITSLSQKQLVEYRRSRLGFIFQFYNLVPDLTIKENIQVCEYLSKNPLNTDELIDKVGLSAHRDKYPSQLSGGEQQRCAIARALVKNPDILICDEPTGALDYKTSKKILKLLEDINRDYGTTLLVVTHNDAIRNMSDHVIRIRDGVFAEDSMNEKRISAEEITW